MRMTKEEKDEIIDYILTNRGIEIEKKGFEKDSIIPEMKERFRQEGYNFKYYFEIEFICRDYPEETKEILLYFYKKAKLDGEKDWIVKMLTSKENKDLIPYFSKEFLKPTTKGLNMIGIGNFLEYTIDKKYMDEYIEILKEYKYNEAEEYLDDPRSYILMGVGKFKDERVKKIALEIIDQPTLPVWCIRCLNKYKDESLRPVFEKYLNAESTEVRRWAKKAIENLDKQKLRRESK